MRGGGRRQEKESERHTQHVVDRGNSNLPVYGGGVNKSLFPWFARAGLEKGRAAKVGGVAQVLFEKICPLATHP